MRKGGVFALITYILYTLLFGGLYIALLKWLESIEDEELYPVALVILVVIAGACLALAIGGLVAVVLKLLHMVTGWLIFGIPCVLIDIYSVLSAISVFVEMASTGELFTGGILIMLIPMVFSVGALISNIKSLQN